MHHHVLRHAKSVALAGLLAVAVASAANAQKKAAEDQKKAAAPPAKDAPLAKDGAK